MPASKYSEELLVKAVEACKQGATDKQLVDILGVAESTLNVWKHRHPEFQKALILAKGMADEQVEASLYHKALGFHHPDVHISNFKGKITVTEIMKFYPPDTIAAIFWLKNRQPERWRDVRAVELSGNLEVSNASECTDEELQHIATGSSDRAAEATTGKEKPSGIH